MSICVCALVNVCVETRLSACDGQISNLLEILNIDGLFISFHKIVHLKHMKNGNIISKAGYGSLEAIESKADIMLWMKLVDATLFLSFLTGI